MNELEKYNKTLKQRGIVGEFLDWLNKEKILLGTYIKFKDYAERMAPILQNQEELLDQYFGTNPVQLDKERKELLNRLGAYADREEKKLADAGRE